MAEIQTSIDGNEVVLLVDEWAEQPDGGKVYADFHIVGVAFPWLGGLEVQVEKGSDVERILVDAYNQEMESAKVEHELAKRGIE